VIKLRLWVHQLHKEHVVARNRGASDDTHEPAV